MKRNQFFVYEIMFPDGSYAFEISDVTRSASAASSLKEIASVIKDEVDLMNEKKELGQINLTFTPPADIQFPSNLRPRRCFQLSVAEQDELWELVSEF